MGKVYITFGQDHAHKFGEIVFDKDCVAILKCDDYAEGREKAFHILGPKWCFCYDEGDWLEVMKGDLRNVQKYFPKGYMSLTEAVLEGMKGG